MLLARPTGELQFGGREIPMVWAKVAAWSALRAPSQPHLNARHHSFIVTDLLLSIDPTLGFLLSAGEASTLEKSQPLTAKDRKTAGLLDPWRQDPPHHHMSLRRVSSPTVRALLFSLSHSPFSSFWLIFNPASDGPLSCHQTVILGI